MREVDNCKETAVGQVAHLLSRVNYADVRGGRAERLEIVEAAESCLHGADPALSFGLFTLQTGHLS